MAKRIIIFIFLTVTCIPCCASRHDIPKLRIGILPVIDSLPLIVACEKGFFRQEGIDVELINFNSALERDAALKGKALDGYFGDLLNTILLNKSGENLRILSQAYHTHPKQRMFVLLASPGSGIHTINQIKGIPIAISKASIIEYFLDEIIATSNIPENHVKKIEIRLIPIRYQMLMANSVKLALLPEPLASKALSGGAIFIADDRNLDTASTVIAIDENYLKLYPQLGKQFLKAYRKDVNTINHDPESFKDILIKKTRFPVSLRKHYTIPLFPEAFPPSPDDVSRVANWLLKNSLLSEKVTYKDLIWSETSKK